MNCKETEKNITPFLQEELIGSDLEEFVEHIENCPECMEELAIQFLVTEGMDQLESGDSFNLQGALAQKVARAKRSMRVRWSLQKVLYSLEAAVVLAIIFAVCVGFRLI